MKEFDYAMLNSPKPSRKWFNFLGDLVITEGTLVVGDPYREEFRELSQPILPGKYPVISHFHANNEIVFLPLQGNDAVRWENVPVVNGVSHSWYDVEFQGQVRLQFHVYS